MRFSLLAGGLALLLAFESERFFSVALFAYTLYGASITPPLLAAFFWPRATPAGAVGAMIAGLAGASAWRFGGGAALASASADAGLEGLAPFLAQIGAALPAVVFSTLVLVVLSLLTRRPAPAAART